MPPPAANQTNSATTHTSHQFPTSLYITSPHHYYTTPFIIQHTTNTTYNKQYFSHHQYHTSVQSHKSQTSNTPHTAAKAHPPFPYKLRTHSLPFCSVSLFLVVVVAAVALAKPSDPYHQPTYKPEPIPYNFAYGVKDDYAGTDFGHNEDSDGQAVKGSYNVVLPDGRIQTVEYVADHYNGFQAQVKYKGEAQYPHDYAPAVTFKPSGGYDPQPSYH
ncbi:hypothetical protein Pcinc_029393 [Petrolisthes cinctipes]|uniref:Uncharacterized protein n=1 Tax=Petrolisthes cinctipes TaxID=88211 RepID=A0AAE1F0Y6_PETCI|nr:hypothetical protein Pcinc_029393 [Petrolisthes cinctipes]